MPRGVKSYREASRLGDRQNLVPDGILASRAEPGRTINNLKLHTYSAMLPFMEGRAGSRQIGLSQTFLPLFCHLRRAMPKVGRPLTDNMVRTLKPSREQDRAREISDGGCRGLLIRITPRGEKLWAIRIMVKRPKMMSVSVLEHAANNAHSYYMAATLQDIEVFKNDPIAATACRKALKELRLFWLELARAAVAARRNSILGFVLEQSGGEG